MNFLEYYKNFLTAIALYGLASMIGWILVPRNPFFPAMVLTIILAISTIKFGWEKWKEMGK